MLKQFMFNFVSSKLIKHNEIMICFIFFEFTYSFWFILFNSSDILPKSIYGLLNNHTLYSNTGL